MQWVRWFSGIGSLADWWSSLLQLFWYHGYVTRGKAAPQEHTLQFCNSILCTSSSAQVHVFWYTCSSMEFSILKVCLWSILFYTTARLQELRTCTYKHQNTNSTDTCAANFRQNHQILLYKFCQYSSYPLGLFLCQVKTIVCLQYENSDLIKVDCLFTLRSQPHSLQHESSTGHTAS